MNNGVKNRAVADVETALPIIEFVLLFPWI